MSSASETSVMVIIQSPPNADLEAAELILALAAFDLPVTVVFRDAGLFWLLSQESRKPKGKSPSKLLSAFPLYGIETLHYLSGDSLRFGVPSGHLPDNAQSITEAELQHRLQQSTSCLTF